ncbi:MULTISPECIES: hypothetical protein [unclassified Cryobacterium]|uniref:hypothetical protein n=1 Tax=unclassified Cryobacterium TaxID=2649013 RepID=UPI0018C9E515|nr:hypothetical protein [Cryobacterium sp. CAN_C3]
MHENYAPAGQWAGDATALIDLCVDLAFESERSLRKRGWDDEEATQISAELRMALFTVVAPTIFGLGSLRARQASEDTQ